MILHIDFWKVSAMRRDKTIDTLLRTEECENEGRYYRYELLMRESLRVASYGIPLYSITVTMRDRDGKTTRREVTEAFADAGQAISFFEKLVRNFATPIDLIYVAEDELARSTN